MTTALIVMHTVCIDFEEPSYTVCEGEMNTRLCLMLTGDLGRDVTVTFQTMDDSALCTCYVWLCEKLSFDKADWNAA